jgi:hypothetical protein
MSSVNRFDVEVTWGMEDHRNGDYVSFEEVKREVDSALSHLTEALTELQNQDVNARTVDLIEDAFTLLQDIIS